MIDDKRKIELFLLLAMDFFPCLLLFRKTFYLPMKLLLCTLDLQRFSSDTWFETMNPLLEEKKNNNTETRQQNEQQKNKMLLKRLLPFRCTMRQLLVKQSSVVRNGSCSAKFRDCYALLQFDFIRIARVCACVYKSNLRQNGFVSGKREDSKHTG